MRKIKYTAIIFFCFLLVIFWQVFFKQKQKNVNNNTTANYFSKKDKQPEVFTAITQIPSNVPVTTLEKTERSLRADIDSQSIILSQDNKHSEKCLAKIQIKRNDDAINKVFVATVFLGDFQKLVQFEGIPRAGYLRVSLNRSKDELIVMLWSNLAKKALQINFINNTATLINTPEIETFSWTPSTEADIKYQDDYIVYKPGNKAPAVLRFKNNLSVLREIPWDEQVLVYTGWFLKNYPFGLCFTKDKLTNRIMSTLIIDKQQSKILTTILLPKENVTPSLQMVLDPNSHAAVLFDHNLEWIIIIDLQHLTNKNVN